MALVIIFKAICGVILKEVNKINHIWIGIWKKRAGGSVKIFVSKYEFF